MGPPSRTKAQLVSQAIFYNRSKCSKCDRQVMLPDTEYPRPSWDTVVELPRFDAPQSRKYFEEIVQIEVHSADNCGSMPDIQIE